MLCISMYSINVLQDCFDLRIAVTTQPDAWRLTHLISSPWMWRLPRHHTSSHVASSLGLGLSWLSKKVAKMGSSKELRSGFVCLVECTFHQLLDGILGAPSTAKAGAAPWVDD